VYQIQVQLGHVSAWYLSRHADRKIIEASHTVSLAHDFGREVRNLVATDDCRKIFPGLTLSRDAKAAGRWTTAQGGFYFAVGTAGAIAGRSADLFIIDHPHSKQDVLENSKAVFERCWQLSIGPAPKAPAPRRDPRRHEPLGQLDLTGRLYKQSLEDIDGEVWELLELPAILPSGHALWPEFWPLEEMLRTKAKISVAAWNGQYMLKPAADEADHPLSAH
jgi:hypothetical protein